MTTGVRNRKSIRNEGKACGAVVRCIERRTGETRAAIRRPETEGTGPPVDFRLMLGVREHAIEHTQIEAIAGLIRADERYGQLIEPVIEEVSGTLPGSAVYALHFPIDTHLGVQRANLARIRRDLIAWIRAKAQCLYERNRNRLGRKNTSPRYLDSVEAKPPGFPYAVRLWIGAAHSESKWGSLRLAHLGLDSEELEARRADRLREALRRKCPKLQRCKEDGARTVLARLRQLGLFGDDNSLIFRDRTPKGRHYTARPGEPSTGFRTEASARVASAMSSRAGAGAIRGRGSAGYGAPAPGGARRRSAHGGRPSGWRRTSRRWREG